MSSTTPVTFQSDRGPLRVLSPEELITHADLIRKQQEWQRVYDFARNCFGPAAASVEIDSSEGDSDDEGGLTYSINYVTVYDKDENWLYPDLTLPYWDTTMTKYWEEEIPLRQSFVRDIQANYRDGKDYDQWPEEKKHEYLVDACTDYMREDSYGAFNLPYNDREGSIETYQLDQPPISKTSGFPILYVAATLEDNTATK